MLERVSLSIPKTLEQMGCLQAQYAPAMYIGLWSRIEGFRRDDLTRALEDRSVVQGTLMRVTIHLVSTADYWPLAVATREARRRWWLRADPARLTVEDLEAAAATLRARLDEGPVRRKEMDELLGKQQVGGVGLWLDMVRVPPSGTWERRRADLYGAADDWIGPPGDVDVNDAIDQLVRRYLTGFGPSTVPEIADWSGLAVGDVRAALERLPLRRFATEDGQELVDVRGAPLPDADTPAPVRFLAVWDAMLLVHARRKRVLSEEHRPLIFNIKNPHSMNAFLVDGTVAGTWRYDKGAVLVEPFGRIDKRAKKAVDDEAERLMELYA